MIQHWIDQIDETTTGFKAAFEHLNEEALNWKPAPDKWSIAQNIDHLITIDTSYFPIIQAAEEESLKLPFISRIGLIVKGFGKMILGSVKPDRSRPSKTFPVWEPSSSNIDGSIVLDFEFHQRDLKILIERSIPLLLRGIIIHSPANKNIVYTLKDAFEIIVTHQKRHLAQAKEVLQLMPEDLKEK